jgi:putative colanic acid biosynthesis UDP-glucose lipid carrier transferase
MNKNSTAPVPGPTYIPQGTAIPVAVPAIKRQVHSFRKRPLDIGSNRNMKRVADISGALLLIILLLSWLYPLLAVLIKLSSKGPVLFRQKRNKKGGSFYCLKFRTMHLNKEADLQAAIENDPRITKLGRFLRVSHLDELPQLINVLAGDMSLVGPRPYMISDHENYSNQVPGFTDRLFVKPGLTGLAQASGHFGCLADAHAMKERLDFDLEYIYHWSPWMDIRILYRTLLLPFSGHQS